MINLFYTPYLARPGGMMGMGGVVAMRRNADYSSDYAFEFSEDDGGAPGHPDLGDYTLDYDDYSLPPPRHQGGAGARAQGDVHQDYSDYSEVGDHHFDVERGAQHQNFILYDVTGEGDYDGFEYNIGGFDYY